MSEMRAFSFRSQPAPSAIKGWSASSRAGLFFNREAVEQLCSAPGYYSPVRSTPHGGNASPAQARAGEGGLAKGTRGDKSPAL